MDKSHEIQDEIAKHKSKSTTNLAVKKGKKKKKGETLEVMVDVKAKLGGISVLVTSKQGGDITSILIGGMTWIIHFIILTNTLSSTMSFCGLFIDFKLVQHPLTPPPLASSFDLFEKMFPQPFE